MPMQPREQVGLSGVWSHRHECCLARRVRGQAGSGASLPRQLMCHSAGGDMSRRWRQALRLHARVAGRGDLVSVEERKADLPGWVHVWVEERFARREQFEFAGWRLVRIILGEGHRHWDARTLPNGAILAGDDDFPVEDVLRAVGKRRRFRHKALWRGVGSPAVNHAHTMARWRRESGGKRRRQKRTCGWSLRQLLRSSCKRPRAMPMLAGVADALAQGDRGSSAAVLPCWRRSQRRSRCRYRYM